MTDEKQAKFIQSESMEHINFFDIERFRYSKESKSVEMLMRTGKSEKLFSEEKMRSQLTPRQQQALKKLHDDNAEYILNHLLNYILVMLVGSKYQLITQQLLSERIMSAIEEDKATHKRMCIENHCSFSG